MAWLVFPSLIYLMLAFPQGRLDGGAGRALFRALIAVLVLLYLGSALVVERYPQYTPWATCRDDCPANAFLLLQRRAGGGATRSCDRAGDARRRAVRRRRSP